MSGSITAKKEKKRWHLKDKIKLLYLNEYSISTSETHFFEKESTDY